MKLLHLAFSALTALTNVNDSQLQVINPAPYVEVIQEEKKQRTVPILMYHEIGEPGVYGRRYTVSAEMFRSQLKRLHRKGYSTISIDDYVSGRYKRMERKPCMLTFDDATAGQFRYVWNESGLRSIDKNSAVGIIREFSGSHPDFGHNAVFFIDFVDKSGEFEVPFGQEGYEKRKLVDLLEMGMEIGNHTQLHTDMKKASGKDMVNAIRFGRYMIDLLGGTGSRYFAFPYGAKPSITGMEEIKDIANFSFAAWGGAAPGIDSKKFDRHAIPRIEINNDFKNLDAYVQE